MISAVIVSLGTRAKTVQSVGKITQIFNYIQFLQLVNFFIDFSFFFFVMVFVGFTKLIFTSRSLLLFK